MDELPLPLFSPLEYQFSVETVEGLVNFEKNKDVSWGKAEIYQYCIYYER